MKPEESETPKILAPRNRTIQLTEGDHQRCRSRLLKLNRPATTEELLDRTICQDLFAAIDWLPASFVDLLFLDPPYNLNKLFHGQQVKRRSLSDYTDWLDSWLSRLLPCLKPEASIYLCGDWQSSPALYEVASRYFIVRNRITWEREKGRSARSNWKNCAEDIWFCTVSDRYYFDAPSVRLCRRVRAPYTDRNGEPKDWQRSDRGNFRLTAASNLWTDLTVPFWSMPENTNHPTQKPEKLLAKIILASCPIAGVVLDPFLGSGTASVVAKKLDRHFVGIEIEEYYACLAEKRLEMAVQHPQIQGWRDRVFWERNSQP